VDAYNSEAVANIGWLESATWPKNPSIYIHFLMYIFNVSWKNVSGGGGGNEKRLLSLNRYKTLAYLNGDVAMFYIISFVCLTKTTFKKIIGKNDV
jgi:hypothetical protein